MLATVAGKDRTGLIVMLLLLLCDVDPKVSQLLLSPHHPVFAYACFLHVLCLNDLGIVHALILLGCGLTPSI